MYIYVYISYIYIQQKEEKKKVKSNTIVKLLLESYLFISYKKPT